MDLEETEAAHKAAYLLQSRAQSVGAGKSSDSASDRKLKLCGKVRRRRSNDRSSGDLVLKHDAIRRRP